MQAACMAALILALGACNAAAEPVKLRNDRQLPADQHAGRHLLQGVGCPGPYCPGGPAQTGPAQMAGPGGGGAGAGAAAGSPSARAAPTTATPAALNSPAAAGAVSSPGLSPDGKPVPIAHYAEICVQALAAKLPVTESSLSVLATAPDMSATCHGFWLLSSDVRAAASALQFFQQGITNWRDLKAWGFKGWDFVSSPCQGWSGVSCDTLGRVSKL